MVAPRFGQIANGTRLMLGNRNFGCTLNYFRFYSIIELPIQKMVLPLDLEPGSIRHAALLQSPKNSFL
jgi:hypothetical protein